jgi:glutamate formiminotransferase
MLECVVNISEGRDDRIIDALAAETGPGLLDVHRDPDHHRSVLTIAGPEAEVEAAVRGLARAAVHRLGLSAHAGAHPRIGVLDVVPWVALDGWPVADGRLSAAIDARDAFIRWAADTLDLPCFAYGPERTLPDVRRQAWVTLDPDAGPLHPHPTAGAAAVGARGILVAYNLWLAKPDLDLARGIASALRSPDLRTLALEVGTEVQVSCNLTRPWVVGPAAAFDAVSLQAEVARAELVGLAPRSVLDATPRHRWPELDLDPSTTIEARLEQAGLDGGRLQRVGRAL